MTPEHLHLAINHIPIIGPALSVIPILFGIFGRNRVALASGLAMAALCGWSVAVVIESGEGAYDRYHEATQHGIALDAGAIDWAEVHEEDAESLSIVMYVTAGAATLGLLLNMVHRGGAIALSWIVVIGSLASLAVGIVIADSGGKIRRPDFRTGKVPQESTEYFADPVHCDLDLLA